MTTFTPFIAAAAALAALTVLLLTQPWWRPWLTKRRPTATDFSEAAEVKKLNVAIYRDQLAELARERAIGQLAEADYQSARDEINLRLLEDTDEAAAPVGTENGAKATGSDNPLASPATPSRRRRAPTWLALIMLVPLAAASIYLQLGTPAAVLDTQERAKKSMMDMEQAITSLANKLKANPDNPDGWAMLARSYGMLGRWDEASAAFEKIGPTLATNADLLASYAEVKFRASDNTFTPEVRSLVAQALVISPDNMHALLLAGSDAFQNERWSEVIDPWQKLVAQLDPESDDAREITDALNQARAKLGIKAPKLAQANPAAKVSPHDTAPATAPGKEAISGRVELSPELRKLAKPDDTLFVFARAVSSNDVPAPRMPLAAKRLRVADLPYDFTLDDSMAMSPAMKISAFPLVRIEARISSSGTATPASGDLSGESTPIKPGSQKVSVRISKQVP